MFDTPPSNGLLPSYDTQPRQSNIELRTANVPAASHNSGLNWGLEYNRLNFGPDRATISPSSHYRPRDQSIQSHQSYTRKNKATSSQYTNAKHRPSFELGYGFQSATNLWKSPSITSSDMGYRTRLPAPIEAIQYPAVNLEKTLEDFDWEALFASLDSTARAMDDHAEVISSALAEINTEIDPDVADDATTQVIESVSDNALETGRSDDSLNNSRDAFQKGMQIIHEHGNLSLAILAFQEASQLDPLHFEAWKMLGSVLTEVEREAEAILAFKEALELEPDSLDVIMRLSVSYTNEGCNDLAYEHLEQWMGIKYPQISIPKQNAQPALSDSWALFERIKEPFIQAARLSLNEEQIDPDVQIGLGVLMFSNRLYDMAADCFQAAIQATGTVSTRHQSQLHLLWNRYAACLGNVRDKEQLAIEAYETALSMKPNFVKARCNLGVLYHNINQPLLGARNILEAIMWKNAVESTTIHRIDSPEQGRTSGTNDQAVDYDETTEMYETLTKCCSSMCRWDLSEMVGPDMDLESFKMELDKC